jgi:hypothetical protein
MASMFARKSVSFLALFALLASGACQTSVNDLSSDKLVFPDMSKGADGKADSASMTEEKRSILLAMKARYAEQRSYKEMGLLGENYSGLVQLPDVGEVIDRLAEQSDELKQQFDTFNTLENTDRNAYYDLLMMEHDAVIKEQVKAQEPEIRKQVVEQLCAELPLDVLCETLTEVVIGAALDEALKISVQQALIEIRKEVQAVHAEFWQSRTCRNGEWIEIAGEHGYVWRSK